MAATALVLALVAAAPGAAQGASLAQQGDAGDPNVHLDVSLVEALLSVDLGEAWLEGTDLNRELALVQVDGERAAAAQAVFVQQAGALVETQVLLDLLVVRERALDRRVDRTQGMIQRRATTQAALEADAETVRAGLGQAAVERYVMGRSPAPLSVDLSEVYDLATNRMIVEAAVEDLFQLHGTLEGRIDELEAEIGSLEVDLAEASDGLVLVRDQISQHGVILFDLQESVPQAMLELRDARRLSEVSGLGLSLVTVDAYLNGARQIAVTHPGCGIRWQALAGIGRVESNHGRGQGGYVEADGRTTTAILGPLLDGEIEDFAEVVDSDGGALDGNAEFDRAVGPMQFLPSTWRAVALDGNGDGVTDPHNLYDAALSAARYLCDRVSPLTDDGLLRESFLSYNFSGDYADNVLSWVHDYDEFVLPLVPEPASDPTLDPT